MLFLLKGGQWMLVPEWSYMMNQVAWSIIIVAASLAVVSLLWSSVRKPLSRFMKIKKAYVQVVYVSKVGINASSFKNMATPYITVRMLDTKRKKRKRFYMSTTDLCEGEKGVILYQGVYGLEFKADSQIVQKDYYQKFGFAKKKNEREADKTERRTQHKRKYW